MARQDLHAVDLDGRETDAIVKGLGTLYAWNVWSPRLGVTAKLTANGRTMMRASYGRFHQGVLTGENSAFHPGATPTTTADFVPAEGIYRVSSVVDPRTNLLIDAGMRAPRTDEYSIELDREIGRHLSIAAAYVRKTGADFIGWTDVGGEYRQESRSLAGGRLLPVFVLVNPPADRRFLLTNPAGYSLAYDGVVAAVDRRRSGGWQAFGSYSYSKQSGLQASSGGSASAAQSSTDLPQNAQQRVLLEPRGSRRLSSQSLLDVRVSRTIRLGGAGRADLFLDVLNLLNDAAEESFVSENLFSANFGQPNAFVDPRRAMVGVRLNVGR